MIRRLSRCIREYKWAALLSPLCMVGEVAMEVLIPLVMADLYDYGIKLQNMQVVAAKSGILVLCALASLAFGVLSAAFASKAGTGFAKNLRHDMQFEIKRITHKLGMTTISVTHDQEEAMAISDRIAVMKDGVIQQQGKPEDIYNEPKNAFVADFIGDSNIVDGVMHRDFLVSFSGVEFPCVDRGFAREESVQVVVRPEDIEVVSPVEGQLVGVVNDVIFKGVHFEMHVECEGREWLIHSTRACTPGETIGMRIGPNEIHIMSRS